MRTIARGSCWVLYELFNWACVIVYAYQICLWIRRGAWTKIPSRSVMPSGSVSRLFAGSGTIDKVFQWLLNVEFAYALCAVAMVFFGLKWLAGRRAQ